MQSWETWLKLWAESFPSQDASACFKCFVIRYDEYVRNGRVS